MVNDAKNLRDKKTYKAYNAIYQVLMELNEVMKAPDHATDHEFNLSQGSNRRSTKVVCILLQFYFFCVFRNMSAYRPCNMSYHEWPVSQPSVVMFCMAINLATEP